jgi:hypothetical protein
MRDLNISILALVAFAGCLESTTDNFDNPPPGPPSTCTQTAQLPGCDNGSLSYACTTGRPDDCPECGEGSAAHQGPNLVCDVGTAGVGTTLYCCAPYATYYSECAPDPAIPGCGASAFGFACTGDTSPSEADAELACSAPIAGSDATRYCCNSVAIPPTCAADATIACAGVAVGYACAGSTTPSATDPTLTCVASTSGGQTTPYCCTLP